MIYNRPKFCLLTPVLVLLLIALSVYWYIEGVVGSVASIASGPPPSVERWPSETLDPYPATLMWDLSGADGQSSALFDRGGATDLQLVYDPQASSVVRLLAPDGWTIQADLLLGESSYHVEGTYPIDKVDVGLGWPAKKMPSGNIGTVGVRIKEASYATQLPPTGNASKIWNLNGSTSFTSDRVAFDKLKELTLKFSGSDSGQASLKLCAPGKWKLHYRLYLDGVSRTFARKFKDSEGFLGLTSSHSCDGSDFFSRASTSYGIVGFQILEATPPKS